MFGSTTLGASAYAKVGVETGVAAASPHKLVLMLFEGAMAAIAVAKHPMQVGDIQAKGKAISKAISIIDNGLRASLDKEAGGEIAMNLDALYEYMSNRLLLANVNNQPDMLDEVHSLLKDLKEAWEAIGEVPASPSNADAAFASKEFAARDPLAPQIATLVKA